MNRREFLLSAGGATGGAAALGAAAPAAAQETETTSGEGGGDGGGGSAGPPDYGTWFSNVDNYADETVDATGQDGALDSGSPVAEAGVNYEETIDEDGIYKYECVPHAG